LKKLGQRIARGALVKEPKIHEAIGRLKERYPRVARYYAIHYDAKGHSLSWTEDAEKKERVAAPRVRAAGGGSSCSRRPRGRGPALGGGPARSPCGLVGCAWRLGQESITIDAAVPPNNAASVCLPGREEHLDIGSGRHQRACYVDFAAAWQSSS
jgi:hypothetical protein